MSVLLWSLLLAPAVAGSLLAVAGRRADRWAFQTGVVLAAGLVGLSAVVANTRPRASAPFLLDAPVGFGVDGLTAAFVVTAAAVTLAVLLAGRGEVSEHRARFTGLILIFAGAVMATATARTLPALLFAWEVMGATSWALIGFWWRDPDRARSGTVAFLTTRTADLGLYAAAGAAYGSAPGLRLDALAGLTGWRLDTVAAGVLIACLGKAAQLPFSVWLSRAMAGPSPVSALLHSAAMVAAGGYLLLRLAPLLAVSGWADTAAAWAGAGTALLLGLVALAQTDLKQLLAASTASQLGFVVLAAGDGDRSAGALQLVAHAAAKSLLFLAAGSWLAALGTKRLSSLSGAGRVYPAVGFAAAVGALTLGGVPPLPLWTSKDDVLAGALGRSVPLYLLALGAAAVSALYAGRVAGTALRPLPPRERDRGWDDEEQGTRTVDRTARAALLALAGMCLLLSALAVPAVGDQARQWVAGTAGSSPVGWQLALSAVLAATGFGWAVTHPARPVPLPGLFARWLDLERLTGALVVSPVLRLAGALAAGDDRGLDRAVTRAAQGTQTLARHAAVFDDRGIDRAVELVAAGARRLGGLARLPQTGQIHQYYAQALAGFALLLVLVALVR